MNIYLDIETLPAQSKAVRDEFIAKAIANYKAPSELTKEKAAQDLELDAAMIKALSKSEVVSLWENKFREKEAAAVADIEIRKTSFDGAQGHVCVIGWAIDDEPAQELHISGVQDMVQEILLLAAFSSEIDKVCKLRPNERPRFIGHNLIEFDLRFLFQRSVVLQVKPSKEIPFSCKPWDDSVYDTMQKWGARVGGSLDKISKACGLKGKGDIDGSMVADYVRDGRIVEVADYCKDDINMTRALYKRMTFQ